MADCFNKPNFWLYDKKLNEGTLKFEDYFASQNRQVRMFNYIDSILKSNCDEYGNKINLNLLIEAFPHFSLFFILSMLQSHHFISKR